MLQALEVQRIKMRTIAKAMRDELTELKTASKRREGGHKASKVGSWDVAQKMGTGVDSSHQAMIAAYERFILAYEQVIDRIDLAVIHYERNEQDVTDGVNGIKRDLLDWTRPKGDGSWD